MPIAFLIFQDLWRHNSEDYLGGSIPQCWNAWHSKTVSFPSKLRLMLRVLGATKNYQTCFKVNVVQIPDDVSTIQLAVAQ